MMAVRQEPPPLRGIMPSANGRPAYDEVSEKDLEMARRMYQKGYGVSQLSVKFGRDRKAIKLWVEGLERGPRTRCMSEPWEREAACRLAAEGVGLTEIARRMKRSEGTVAYWLEGMERPEKPAGETDAQRKKREASERAEANRALREQRKAEALRLYEEQPELSRLLVARSVGVSIGTLNGWLTTAGLELRTASSRKRS